MSPAEIYEQDHMAYAGAVPWHRLGTGVEDAMSSEQALELARLTWRVRTTPVLAPPVADGDAPIVSPDLVSIQRMDTGVVLGTATRQYEPIQNVEGAEFLDSLFADGFLEYETAGSLRNGRTVWLLARLREDMRVADEVWHRYLLWMNGHDGRRAGVVKKTDVRVVCANTLDMALGDGISGVTLRHTRNVHERMAEAQRVMEITTEATRRLREFLDAAATKPVTEAALAAVERDLFGDPDERKARTQNKVEAFKRIAGEEVMRNGQTAYSLLNAITGYVDHVRSPEPNDEMIGAYARAERRFESVLMGSGARAKSSAVKTLMSATGLTLAK